MDERLVSIYIYMFLEMAVIAPSTFVSDLSYKKDSEPENTKINDHVPSWLYESW